MRYDNGKPIVEKGLSFNRRDDYEYKTAVDKLKYVFLSEKLHYLVGMF